MSVSVTRDLVVIGGGVRGFPDRCLRAVQELVAAGGAADCIVYLLTAWRRFRRDVSNALFIRTPDGDHLVLDGFGPAHEGPEAPALGEALRLLRDGGAISFKESVFSWPDFERMLAKGGLSAADVLQLTARANPLYVDPRTLGFIRPRPGAEPSPVAQG
jgi:hypothetical protein